MQAWKHETSWLHDVFFQRSHVWICGQTRSNQNCCCWGRVYGQTFWIKTLKWPHSNPSLDWSWDQVPEGDGLVDDSCKILAKNHWIPLSFGQNCLDPHYFPILNPHQSISRTLQHIPTGHVPAAWGRVNSSAHLCSTAPLPCRSGRHSNHARSGRKIHDRRMESIKSRVACWFRVSANSCFSSFIYLNHSESIHRFEGLTHCPLCGRNIGAFLENMPKHRTTRPELQPQGLGCVDPVFSTS